MKKNTIILLGVIFGVVIILLAGFTAIFKNMKTSNVFVFINSIIKAKYIEVYENLSIFVICM